MPPAPRRCAPPPPETTYPYGVPCLDTTLGPVRRGKIYQWGLGRAPHGRELLVNWLAEHQTPTTLWVHDRAVLPEAWLDRGANLERIWFATTPQPLRDLLPAFREPCFAVWIFDQAKLRLSQADTAFLARAARTLGCIAWVIDPHSLRPGSSGSVFFYQRCNLVADLNGALQRVELLRGSRPGGGCQ